MASSQIAEKDVNTHSLQWHSSLKLYACTSDSLVSITAEAWSKAQFGCVHATCRHSSVLNVCDSTFKTRITTQVVDPGGFWWRSPSLISLWRHWMFILILRKLTDQQILETEYSEANKIHIFRFHFSFQSILK